jgi:hypothetical protein
MCFHRAAAAASHACSRIAVATAIISITTACSDGRNATSGDDAELLSLSFRNNRHTLAISARDSSLVIGDTARITLPAPTYRTLDGSQRVIARYRSSDTGVVTVDLSGVMRAKGAGTATVVVRTLAGIGAIAMSVSPADTAATPAPSPADSTATPAAPTAPAPPETAPPEAAPPSTAPPAIVTPANPGTLPSFVAPQLPQATVDISTPAAASRTYRIAAGDATGLQAALNAAVGGDEIVLADGGIYAGSFHLPNRASGGTVVLRSSTIPVPARTRITPSQAGSLATLVTNSVFPALSADDGAHGWRVVGVKMQLTDGAVDNYGIVTLGSGVQTSAAQFPRDIVLDRVFVNGSTTGNTSRCVSMNGVSLAVIDSWLAECHAKGRDAQAIGAWTGTGPLLIENNHLEGSGQAILFGGSDPLVYGVVPGDITIRRNHLFKPLSWAGQWTVKAAFEIKNAERVLFEANVIENHWTDAQVGFAILLQAVNQDGKAPWSSIRDVTMRLNAIRNSRSGINLLSRLISASSSVTDVSRRILVRDNSFENVGRDPINGAAGRYVQLLDDLEDVTIVQNTFFGSGANNAVMFDGKATVRLALANNVFAHATYGILGSGLGEGLATLARFAPGSSVNGNVLPGLLAQLYGAGSAFPASLTTSDLVDAANGNYSLHSSLAFSVLNGARTGVDGAAVVSALAGVTAR